MRVLSKLSLALSVLFSVCSVSLGHDHHGKKLHAKHRKDDLAVRVPGDMKIWKRFDSARFTYYAVGLGACGQVNQPSDFIVALNSEQFGSGSYCFQMITITVNGRSTQAQIMDECPGCPYAGLDFSEGLFKFFADESAGVLYGSWVFGSGAPATTSTPTPTPTTTWQPPTTTSLPTPSTTWSPPPTTTSTSSAPTTTTTWSTSSAIQPNTTVSDSIAVETPIPSGEISSSILAELSLVMVNMGEFLFECDSQ